ncbi:MAG TPA: hypothetical protein VNO55_23440 [Polyangia bacterium]|nr:hypothetical protein [Polyangia bacterium]
MSVVGAGGVGPPGSGAATAGFRRAVAVITAGLLVTGLGWPGMLARLPLGLYLKNQLGLPPQDVAAFWAVGTLAWYIKPLAGLLCDSVPLWGARRRWYLVLGGAAATALWAALAIVPRSYAALLATVTALNVALVIISAAVGGLLIEVGHRHGATGRLSGLRLAIDGVMALVAGPLGGWLAVRAFGWTAAAGAVVVFPLIPLALACGREPTVAARAGWAQAWRPVGIAVRSRALWLVLVFIFIAYLPPGFQTALFYRQQDALKFDPGTMGLMQLLGGAGALVGAVIYARLCHRFRLRALLLAGIALNVVSTALYVRYNGFGSAVVITLASAVMGTLALLPFYDLAARAIPGGSESFGYSLILSAQNLASLAVSEPFGAYLYGRVHVGFANLVWINTAFTAAVILFVPLLPPALLTAREGESYPRGSSNRVSQ